MADHYLCFGCRQGYSIPSHLESLKVLYADGTYKSVCDDCYDKLQPKQEKKTLDKLDEARANYLKVLNETLIDTLNSRVSLPIGLVNEYNKLLEELNK